MQYNRLFLLVSFLTISIVGMAQLSMEKEYKVDNNQFNKPRQAFKVIPAEEKSEQFDVIGFGAISISVSNTADGTPSSYIHNSRVTLPLVLAGAKANYQVVFYNNSDLVPYSVEKEGLVNSVFVPISLYDIVKTKLEQAVTAKKKVQLKVSSKKDGFREAVLQF
jgi:hypothetical protein